MNKLIVIFFSLLIGESFAATNVATRIKEDLIKRCTNDVFEVNAERSIIKMIENSSELKKTICTIGAESFVQKLQQKDLLKCFANDSSYTGSFIFNHSFAYNTRDENKIEKFITSDMSISYGSTCPEASNSSYFSLSVPMIIKNDKVPVIVGENEYQRVSTGSKKYNCSVADDNKNEFATMELLSLTKTPPNIAFSLKIKKNNVVIASQEDCKINQGNKQIECQGKLVNNNKDFFLKLPLQQIYSGSAVWDILCAVTGGSGCNSSGYYNEGNLTIGGLFGNKLGVICSTKD